MNETANEVQTVCTYAKDLTGHVEDLKEDLEGNNEGYALFALDRFEQGVEELEKIDTESS